MGGKPKVLATVTPYGIGCANILEICSSGCLKVVWYSPLWATYAKM